LIGQNADDILTSYSGRPARNGPAGLRSQSLMIEDRRIGQLLVREGIIDENQLNKALEIQDQSYGKPLGAVMMELKMIGEHDFLKVLAKQFHTQYLTTQKLSDLNVPENVLKLVPASTAEKYTLFPVQFKKSTKSLTVVTSNPGDMAAIDEIKFVSGISNVKALVALEESVKAAIEKWYKNDDNAFAMLTEIDDGLPGYELGGASREAEGESSEDSPLDISSMVTPEGAERRQEQAEEVEVSSVEDDGIYLGGMEAMPGDDNTARDSVVIEEVSGESPVEVEEVTVSPMDKEEAVKEEVEEIEAKPLRRTDIKKYRLRMLVMEPHDSIRKFIVKLFAHEGFKVRGVKTREEAVEELERGEYDSLVIKEKDLGEGEEFAGLIAERFPEVELCSIKDYGSAVIGETRAHKRLMSSFLETLDVVMGMLESESGALQGHSHNTAKYARLIAGKLDLPQREVDTIALAAYIHELGKKSMNHRSLLNLEKDADPEDVIESAEIPLKLLGSAKYPLEVQPVIHHQFERWDGEGIPDGLSGEDIPLGSRVLAVVEAFEHLTSKQISQNPLEPTAALEEIKKREGELFEPALVKIFLGVVRDDIYLQQMSTAQEKILVADTEADLITLLELRLVNMGFAVITARSGEEALNKAKAELPALVITEADLPDFSGFELIEKIKQEAELKDVHFMFLSRKDDSSYVNRGFQMGAEDYIIKPVKVEILGAKINTMMNRITAEKKTAAPAAAGVSGSLSEMGLPDIIQILGAGRKTGRITLEDNGKTCHIDMEDGQIVNAYLDDMTGEEAFYKILYWDKGTFSIDPNAELGERLISMANDSLMLEGFRRMDEEARDGGQEEDITLDGSDFF